MVCAQDDPGRTTLDDSVGRAGFEIAESQGRPGSALFAGWRPSDDPVHKFIQTPTVLAVLFEANIHSYRQVFTDGRGHPEDPDPTWYGDSIGSWDGDTLVVDTIGFNDKFWFDFAGHPHTEDLHITERYQRPDLGRLQIQITIVDPKAYTKPWIINRVSNLATNWEIHEYICNEFNVDTEHIVGR